MILFCKGCGVLLGVPMLGLENEFKRVKERQSANEAQLSIAAKILSAERNMLTPAQKQRRQNLDSTEDCFVSENVENACCGQESLLDVD